MIRVSNIRRSYNQSTPPTREFLTSTIVQSNECKVIQQKKDELLISLKKYFANEIQKNELIISLRNIKSNIAAVCPSYVAKSECC